MFRAVGVVGSVRGPRTQNGQGRHGKTAGEARAADRLVHNQYGMHHA